MNHGDRAQLIDVDSHDEEAQQDGNRFENTISGDHGNELTSQNNETTDQAPVKYTSQLAALLITVNVTVGAGLLAMPAAVQASGLISSIMIQVIFLLFVITTVIMCTELTVKTRANSFHQVVKAHSHPIVYQFTQVAILMLVFGTSVAFIVIIGDQSDRVFDSIYGSTFCTKWYMNRRFIMSAVTIWFIKPLCSAKTVDFLKYGSFAGVLSLAFVIYVVVSEFIKQGTIAKDVNYFPKNWLDLGAVLPVFCLAYQCHLSWVPTAATIRKEEKYKTYVTVTLAMIVSTIIYVLVSVLALLTFGSAIQSDLTESYPGKSWPILTTIAIVAIKCMVTLPPAFLPARLSIIDILTSNSTWFAELSEPKKRFGVTYATLTVALMLALFVPNILVAVDILGCLAVLFVFSIPALCYLSQTKENRLLKQQMEGNNDPTPIYSLKDQFKRFTSFLLIIVGIMMTGLVLYNSIHKILNSTENQPLCRP